MLQSVAYRADGDVTDRDVDQKDGAPTVAGNDRVRLLVAVSLAAILSLGVLGAEAWSGSGSSEPRSDVTSAASAGGPASPTGTQDAAADSTDGGETASEDPGDDPSDTAPVAVAGPVDVALACPTGEVLPARFDDVPVSGAHAPGIDCLWWYGLTQGQADGTYRPLADVSRAAFATLLVRLLETAGAELPVSPPDAFTDDGRSVHQPALDTLAAMGILGGRGDGTVDPGWAVKRGQLASLLAAAWPHLTGETLPEAEDAFPDDDGNLHEGALDRIAAVGILLGDETGAVLPHATGTRAQLATMLTRVLARTVAAGAVAPPLALQSESVSGIAEVTVASADPNPSVYDVDEVIPVDQGAVDVFASAIVRWLDAHLTTLAAGDTSGLDARLVAPVTHERWRAATTDLLWRTAPTDVRYRIDVAELGAPLWASVEVIVTRDGGTARWEVLVVPAGDDVRVVADGPAATSGGTDRA